MPTKKVTINVNTKSTGKGSKFRRRKQKDLNDSHQIDLEFSKDEIAQSILKQGFVQSFVDFFYLTHRQDPNAG